VRCPSGDGGAIAHLSPLRDDIANAGDVRERYCDRCHLFHHELIAPAGETKAGDGCVK